MWMPISFSSGKVARDGIERDRAADALQRTFLRISQAMADLHLDRHAELGAFGVDRVVARMIRRHLEPVRIEMRANEAELADRIFELRDTLHALGRIDAGKPAEARRMLLHHAGDAFRS